MGSLWDSLVDAICRPPRDDAYSLEDLVGGRSGRFSAAGKSYSRKDFALTNRRRQRVLCSLFEGRAAASGAHSSSAAPRASAFAFSSPSPPPPRSPAPVVIYAHCNSGSRRDAEEVLGLLLPAGIAVAALDFSGSGLSEGAHVSLGAREAEDLADLAALLARERGPGCRIAIWGRSMGAVAALLAAAAEAREAVLARSSSSSPASTSPGAATRISAVVLDSPFSSLPELMAELVAKQKLLPLPRAFLSPKGLLLGAMARSVRKRAGFDLRDVAPLRAVSGGDLMSSSSSSSAKSKSKGGGSGSGSSSRSGSAAASADGGSSLSPEALLHFASSLPPALFGHAEQDSFIPSHHSRKLHSSYLGGEKALCAFGGDHNSARPASFRSAALGFLKEALFPAEGGGKKRETTTSNDEERPADLPSFASLGAATAFDAALSAAAPDRHSLGAVAASHAADERESWGRAAAAAFASALASGSAAGLSSLSLSGGGRTTDEEEVLEMERAIAASLEMSCAAAEREAREAKEAALAAAVAAAAATEQLQREKKQRREKQELERRATAAAAVTHRSSFAPPAAVMEAAAAAAMASFDLTPDQRELHAFFSPPSPKAEGERGESQAEPQRKPAAAAAAAAAPSKRQLALPKAPPVVSAASAAAGGGARKNVEARAGGWKS